MVTNIHFELLVADTSFFWPLRIANIDNQRDYDYDNWYDGHGGWHDGHGGWHGGHESSHVLKKLTYYGNGIMKSRSVICHVHWCIRSEVCYTSKMSKCTVHSLSYSLSLWGTPCLKNQTCEKVKVKCLISTCRPFHPKPGLPRGGGVKKILYLQNNR